MKRKFFKLTVAVFVLCLSAAGMSWAQGAYPDHEILTVVPNSAGGSVDRMVRAVQRFLPDVINVSNIVENRPGAGGKIAFNYFFKKPADGYTLLAYHQPGVTFFSKKNPNSYTLDDLAFINFNWNDPTVLVASKKTGWKTLEDMIQAAKKNPGKYTFGASAKGSAGEVFPKLLFEKLGLDLRVVPYTSSEAKAALMGGHVDMTAGGSEGMLVMGDYVVGLGVFWDTPVASWPNTATINEAIAKYNAKIPNGGSFRFFATHKKFKESHPEQWQTLVAAFKKLMTEHKGFQEYCDKGLIGREWQGPEAAEAMAHEMDKTFSTIKME